ncbi:MAG: hypothetical protein ASARMPRED_007692 [Alectoria sarmentosa]|nr:MAG: hypothetical protein ASARMPRED_007692 [Alectoria sarmentosa]
MSLPTTPTRSIARSRLSTPSTTSTAQHGGPPQELTPRSKIKAMLAAVDDESDSEPILEPKKSGRSALSAVAGNIQRVDEQKSLKEDAETGHREDEDMEGEEESDESPIVPRGRIAARLNGQTSDRRRSSSISAGEGDEDAYARIKKKLLQGHATKTHEPRGAIGSKEAISVARPSKRQRTSSIGSDRADSRASSPTRNRKLSPGIFLTPEAVSKQLKSPRRSVSSDGSDSDLPANPQSNGRLLELLAKTRAERETKNAAENKSKAEKAARQRSFEKALSRDASGSGFSDDDRAADRRLTQHSRPTRKASKKALDEMSRETQRMSRNMQLAHQAKTKKKISKQSLLDRFKFRTSVTPIVEVHQNTNSSTAASSAPASDLEEVHNKDSPPTSPVAPDDPSLTLADSLGDRPAADITDTMQPSEQEDEELPTMLEIMSQPIQKLDKGKGKAIEYSEADNGLGVVRDQKTIFKQRPIKVRPPKPISDRGDVDLDSGSDLEVLPVRKSKTRDVFDRLPVSKVQEGRSMQTLRALAHLNSPDNLSRAKKASMTQADMQMSLQQRARRQAMEERRAKIEDLKRRGIVVQTAEEREKDEAEVEDLVDKARREADEIMQKEKKAAKKERIANGEVDGLADSSDEDDDYQADVDNSDVELSGSDEEEGEEEPGKKNGEEDLSSDGELVDDEDGLVDLGKGDEIAGLIDNEASEDSQDEEDDEATIEDGIEDDEEFHVPQVHRRRTKMVIDDDDDDDDNDEKHEPSASVQQASSAPEIPQFPTLAGPQSIASPMGMTQAFAATMADTQTQGLNDDDEQDSLAFLGPPPEPNFPMFYETDSLHVVEDSQNDPLLNTNTEQNTDMLKEIDLHFTQSQIRHDVLGDTQEQVVASQISEIPDPTQDVGFILSSPAPRRFVSDPPSTLDTILLSGAVGISSPITKKRGRLQRRSVAEEDPAAADETPRVNDHNVADNDATPNAFDLMKKARSKSKSEADGFDKSKSEAKGMVEEQAQESEDEYAGIGGASDDESGGEEDEFVREMIDQGEVNVNEGELAAHYANNERARDEKDIAKLYKDINSGLLRRKRGAEFDLSDSDDDAEARQRRKRRDFAKMRKALLENENVGKIAEDPKKLAFLRAIEDREDEDDLDFLDRPAEDSFRVEPDTQEDPESQSQLAPPESTLGKRKRSLQEPVPDNGNMRPPATARRTQAPKKPATLAEIRESVSFLIEEPGAINIAPDPSSSASEDESSPHNETHPNPRRRPNPNPIIDRLSLKRAESATASSTSHLAFHDPSTTNPSLAGFKVPNLLRRATTTNLTLDNHGITTTATATTERAAGGGEKGDFVRRGGTKKSSVNYFARELEKSKIVDGVERRRKEEREREAKGRMMRLGGLGTGAFE